MTTLATKLKIESWDEAPTREFDDDGKVTRATVVLSDGSDGLTGGTFEALMYYRPDGTSRYVTLMHLSANLEGRSGSFVLTGEGGYDGVTATGTSEIVPDSGTQDLAGISGRCESVSTHADYPYMPLVLTYDVT